MEELEGIVPNFGIKVKNLTNKAEVIGIQKCYFGSENEIKIGTTPEGKDRFKIEIDIKDGKHYLVFDNSDHTLDAFATLATDGEKLTENTYRYPIKNIGIRQSANLCFKLDNTGTDRKVRSIEITANELKVGKGANPVVCNYGKDLFDVTLPNNFVDLFLSNKYKSKGLMHRELPRQLFTTLEANKEYFGLTDKNLFSLKDKDGGEVARVLKIEGYPIDGKPTHQFYTLVGSEMIRIKNPVYYNDKKNDDISIGFRLEKTTKSKGYDGIRAEDMPEESIKEVQNFFEIPDKVYAKYEDHNALYEGEVSTPGKAKIEGNDKVKYAKIKEKEEPPQEEPSEPISKKETPSQGTTQYVEPSRGTEICPKRKRKWLKYLLLGLVFITLVAVTVALTFYGVIGPMVVCGALAVGAGSLISGEIINDMKANAKAQLEARGKKKKEADKNSEKTAGKDKQKSQEENNVSQEEQEEETNEPAEEKPEELPQPSLGSQAERDLELRNMVLKERKESRTILENQGEADRALRNEVLNRKNDRDKGM